MKKISDLLSKFQNLEYPGQKKETLAKLIAEKIGIVIPKDQLNIRNKTLFIQSSSVVKSEIFLQKEKLLEHFRSNIKFKIDDIR